MGILTQVEVQRVIGFILVSLVYLAVVRTWQRHRTWNIFLAYTSILLGTAITLIFAAYMPELTIIRDISIILTVVGSTAFFFLSAYQTNKQLTRLTTGEHDD